MNNIHRWLTRLFDKPEEINGANRCPTYLYRWVLLRTKWCKAYLHHFVGDDWSLDLHDHPKQFISIGLWGTYVEATPCSCEFGISCRNRSFRKYTAPWIRSFPATHIHRLTVPNKNCWTLVIVGPGTREWGFWHEGAFHPFLPYVRARGGIADRMTACAGWGDDKAGIK